MFSMLGFATAVLSSVIFWTIWFLLSIVASLYILKNYWEDAYEIITGKKKADDAEERFFVILMVIITFIFWPLISIIFVVCRIIKYISLIIGKVFVFLFTMVDKVIPNIEIKINKE